MDMIAASYCMVFISASSREEATHIGRVLVTEGLAACCTTLPGVHSQYLWNGVLEESDEVLLFCKTTQAAFSRLEARVRALHSYEVPEILALPITEGSLPYLAWLESTLSPPTD